MSHSKQTEEFKTAVRTLRAIPGTAKGLDTVERYAGHLRRERSGLLEANQSLGEELARLRPLAGAAARVGELEAEVERLKKSKQEAEDFRRRAAALEQELRECGAAAGDALIEACVVRLSTTLTDEVLLLTLGGLTQVRLNPSSVVTCGIVGFDADPRELWDIPEAQSLCRRLVDLGFLLVLYPSTHHPLPGGPPAIPPLPLGGYEVWCVGRGMSPLKTPPSDRKEAFLRDFQAASDRAAAMEVPEWTCVGRGGHDPHKRRGKARS